MLRRHGSRQTSLELIVRRYFPADWFSVNRLQPLSLTQAHLACRLLQTTTGPPSELGGTLTLKIAAMSV